LANVRRDLNMENTTEILSGMSLSIIDPYRSSRRADGVDH
jgi:hypothetical protein